MKNKNLSGNLFTKQALTASEAVVSKMIEQFLDARKIYNDRLNSGKIFIANKSGIGGRMFSGCKKGTPDRFFIIRGKIYFVEVKKLGKKPTPEQIERHAELRNSGAVVLVADSFDNFEAQFCEIIK